MRWFVITIVATVATAAVGVAALVRGRAKRKRLEVGAVSEEWIAQHRASP